MADFAVLSASGQSTENLWPAGGAADVAAVLTQDSNTYWIQLTNGAHVRCTGVFFGYGLNGGVNAPSGGTYTQIDITDSSGVILASLTGISENASDILNMPAAFVLGGADVFTGSAGGDILYGQGGTDQFILHEGDVVSGDYINGGGGHDSPVLSGNDAGDFYLSTQSAIISSIEEVIFSSNGNSGLSEFGLGLDWSEAAGWAHNLAITGRGFSSAADSLTFIGGAATSLDLSGLTFSMWNDDGLDVIEIFGSTSADVVIGSSENDTFYSSTGADQFAGGSGDDTYWMGPGFAGTSFDGGDGLADKIELATSGPISLAAMTLTDVERLNFSSSGCCIASLNASHMTSLLGGLGFTVSGAGGASTQFLDIAMNGAAGLDLGTLLFQNWGTEDVIAITGGAAVETITGTGFSDQKVSGGGLDIINAAGGDDVITIDPDGSGVHAVSINGGSGFDTLRLNFPAAVGNVRFGAATVSTLQSIERLEFAGSSAGYASAHFTFGHEGTSLSSTLQIDGANRPTELRFFADGAQNVDLSGFQFSNWQVPTSVLNYISISGSSAANTITGTSQNDLIISGGGADIINAGGENDIIRYNSYHGLPTGSANGGAGVDELELFFGTTATMDFRTFGLTSMEKLTFLDQDFTASAAFTAIFKASDFVSGINTVTTQYFGNAVATLQIDMGATTTLNLTSLQFGTWGASDTIVINGDAFDESIIGSSRNDHIQGNHGNDVIEGGTGADTLDGGGNFAFGDTLSYVNSLLGVNVNLATNVVYGGDAQGDIISNFENVSGSFLGDVITGTGLDNRLYGNGGRDALYGGAGGDSLYGGDEVGAGDNLYGGADNDILFGAGGNDNLYGDGGGRRDHLGPRRGRFPHRQRLRRLHQFRPSRSGDGFGFRRRGL